MDFKTYYKSHFLDDLQFFLEQIPREGNKHYDKNEFKIQYFFLTPQYKFLDFISKDRQALFAVALFWVVLIDQVFYSKFKGSYQSFRLGTMYPKFIGNCTAPSLMSSECGFHQHPRRILHAINDSHDEGNKFAFEREIFKDFEANQPRLFIDYAATLDQSRKVIFEEIKDFFVTKQIAVNWDEFWNMCISEI